MSYKRLAKTNITTKKGTKLGPYLFERFLEMFGTDDEIAAYVAEGQLKDKDSYFNRVIDCPDGVISIEDYQEFLDGLMTNLPTKYRKKEAKKMLPLIDMYMGPKTMELAEELKRVTTPSDGK